MNTVANLPAEDRYDLFRETSGRRKLHPAIAEKDFWVCFALDLVFSDPELGGGMVFKGGTSLSKVFGLVRRFSEDVDLILDSRRLGIELPPFDPGASNTARDKFNKRLNAAAAAWLAEAFVPRLCALAAGRCPSMRVAICEQDPQTVSLRYPAVFEQPYIVPEIRLEIGPLAASAPAGKFAVRSYAAEEFPEEFPEVFRQPTCEVTALHARRTFWEKATLLHQHAHRTTPMPMRHARHYYDMHQLVRSQVGAEALAELPMLETVAQFKRQFYPCPWAKYEEAKPGTLRLIPAPQRVKELRQDYRAMEVMLFGDIPEFDEILTTLADLERKING